MEDSSTKNPTFVTKLLRFFPDLFFYFKTRLRQIRIWTQLIFEFGILISWNLKREMVKRMFWGRNSFYRKAFHVIIVSITLTIFFKNVAYTIGVSDEQNYIFPVAEGRIGANDVMRQVGNAEIAIGKTGDELTFGVAEYRVEKGDTLASIAKQLGFDSPAPIVWANGLDIQRPKISEGQVLLIPPAKGVLIEAKKGDTVKKIVKNIQNTDVWTVLELNEIAAEDDVLAEGQIIFIPNGEVKLPPRVVATSRPGSGGGSGGITLPLVVPQGDFGIDVPPGTFVNPMGDASCRGYSISRGYASYHTGVDIAKAGGCWILAAGDGNVVKAEFCKGGLGFCVEIQHDNGMRTLYAHGSGQFGVSRGDRVKAGKKILYMGCTGNCRGTHLHLSLTPNKIPAAENYNARINPRNIIPY